jgi:uncharacterized protein involved in exopolysaccharide biosynthesis
MSESTLKHNPYANTNAQPATQAPAMSVRSLAAVLFRRKRIIISLFVLLFGGTVAVTYLTPRQYESRMKVLVKTERADLLVSPASRDVPEVRSEVSEADVNSEIELLSSNDLLARIVRVCRLYADPPSSAKVAGVPQPEAFERAIRKLSKDLKITPVRKANIIQITYAASTPQLSAAVLAEVSAAYLDAHLSVHRSAGTTEFFRDQALRYGNELRAAADRLSEFHLVNDVTSIAEQKDLTLRKVMDTESALHDLGSVIAETDTHIGELRQQVAALSPRIATQSRVLPNQYSVERLNTMLADLENRRTLALMKFRPDDRTVLEIEGEIANTRSALDHAGKLTATEQSSDVNPIRQSLDGELARSEIQSTGLKARRDSLSVTLADYKTRLARLEGASVQEDALQRSVKVSEEHYLLYAKKQEEARIADSLDRQKIANVAIAEAPVEHYLPTKPNVPLNLALGFIIAVVAGIGGALGIEFVGGKLHTPAELEHATGFRVLATVPYNKQEGAFSNWSTIQ